MLRYSSKNIIVESEVGKGKLRLNYVCGLIAVAMQVSNSKLETHWFLIVSAMLMDPHFSQEHAGQRYSLLTITGSNRPKVLPKKSDVDGGAIKSGDNHFGPHFIRLMFSWDKTKDYVNLIVISTFPHPAHHLQLDFPAPIQDASGIGKSDRHSPQDLCSEHSLCSAISHWYPLE